MIIYNFSFRRPWTDHNSEGLIIVWSYDQTTAEQDAKDFLEEQGHPDVKLTLESQSDSTRSTIIYADIGD